MNFKTPFKVLTTAALIGTLSLSAVAPSASAAPASTTSSVKAKATNQVQTIVIQKDGEKYLLDIKTYTVLKKKNDPLVTGSQVVSIALDGKYYSVKEYAAAKKNNDGDIAKALESLSTSTDKAENIAPKALTANENGESVVGEPVPPTEEAEAGDFEVTEVAAITTKSVTVNFPKLAADVKDANVEVKDSKGNVVATESVDLKAGATSADFDFTKAVETSALTGVWTVDGKTYDFDLINLIAEINKAAATSGQDVKFALLLEEGKITNVDDDLVSTYKEAVAAEEPTTLAAVQKIVDTINENSSAVSAIVKELNADSPSKVKIYNALKASVKNVNPDWIADYQTAKVALLDDTQVAFTKTSNISATNVTIEAIQNTINSVNATKVQSLIETARTTLDSKDVAAAKTALETYGVPSALNEKAAKFANDLFAEVQIFVDLSAADTKNSFDRAFNKLVDFDTRVATEYKDATIKYIDPATAKEANVPSVSITNFATQLLKDSKYDSNNYEYYINAFKPENDTAFKRNGRGGVKELIAAGNTAATNAVITNLKGEANPTASYDGVANTGYTNALSELTKATKAGFLKQLKALNLENYASTNEDVYYANKSAFASVTTDTAQGILDTINITKAIAEAKDNDALVTALNVYGIKNIKSEKAYLDKYYEVIVTGNAVDSLQSGADTAAKVTATIEFLQTKITDANTDVAATLEVDKINKAKTIEEVKAALDTLSISDYVNVPTADKAYVAGLVLDQVKEATKTNSDATTYANKAALVTALGTTTTENKILKAYQDTIDAVKYSAVKTSTSTAITQLGKLKYDAFDNLQEAQKAQVAEEFVTNYPFTTGETPTAIDYKTIAATKAALDKIIAELAE